MDRAQRRADDGDVPRERPDASTPHSAAGIRHGRPGGDGADESLPRPVSIGYLQGRRNVIAELDRAIEHVTMQAQEKVRRLERLRDEMIARRGQ
ncbi:MAG: hypothetical protein GEV03_06735 [Streptosporangiales bacterium]|nr:hypothetical protein [Streptosporangiales bacterium]